jgi:hypothetical protein
VQQRFLGNRFVSDLLLHPGVHQEGPVKDY